MIFITHNVKQKVTKIMVRNENFNFVDIVICLSTILDAKL